MRRTQQRAGQYDRLSDMAGAVHDARCAVLKVRQILSGRLSTPPGGILPRARVPV